MKTKRLVVLSSCVLTVVAIVVGICFFFCGNKAIRRTAPTLYVQKIDSQINLVADYDENYSYQFKLEQLMDGEFYVVDVVKSNNNSIELSKQNIQLLSGEVYRFSACFTTETQEGEFGDAVIYICELDDIKNFTKVDNVLKWDEVRGAEGYQLDFVDRFGNLKSFVNMDTSFDMSQLEKGKYVVYLKAYMGELNSKVETLTFEIV